MHYNMRAIIYQTDPRQHIASLQRGEWMYFYDSLIKLRHAMSSRT
ncbi:hypothetical protein [Legionella sp. 16cNR16C]|nr:hypothetical protein [Legionella sp. 16cNR16C]